MCGDAFERPARQGRPVEHCSAECRLAADRWQLYKWRRRRWLRATLEQRRARGHACAEIERELQEIAAAERPAEGFFR
jgi:hypothetical protein